MAKMEFTPEITEDLYNKLSRGIQKRGDLAVGQARGEALARGRAGDAFETSAVGGARAATRQSLADLDAGINFDIAGLSRQERLIGEGRDYASGEAAKERDFREMMAKRGYDWQRDMLNTQNRQSMQAALWQIPLQGAFKAGGAYLGGL